MASPLANDTLIIPCTTYSAPDETGDRVEVGEDLFGRFYVATDTAGFHFSRDDARTLMTLLESYVFPESVAAERVRKGQIKVYDPEERARDEWLKSVAPDEDPYDDDDPVGSLEGSFTMKDYLKLAREMGLHISDALRQARDDEEAEETNRFTDDYGQELIQIHDENSDCHQYGCPVHNPSNEAIAIGRLFWRDDRGIFERICEHGVGHPDHDMLRWMERTRGADYARVESVHGCCWHRCCVNHD